MPQKVDTQERSSLYPGESKRPFRGGSRFFPLLLLPAGLLVAHFLNLYLQWSVISGELAGKSSFNSPEYTFIGFAPLHKEEIAAARRLPNAAPTGRIFAFFDLFHPAVFLVWNNGKGGDFFDLGPIVAALPAGACRVAFIPGSVFVLRHGERSVTRNFGGSILGAFWSRSLNERNGRPGKGSGLLPGSYILKPVRESSSLRVPYLVYFFLPLALIVILIATSGAGMAASFFYYAGMFFLFDFERLFVTAPLAWLFDALGVELHDPWIKVLALALALLFLAAAVSGLLRWKNKEMLPSGKWIVLFFVLLPLALFF